MKTIIVGNWKMNPSRAEDARNIAKAVRKAAESAKNSTVVLCPPAIFLRELVSKYGGTRGGGPKLYFGAQNIYFEKAGSFTGEMSADMVSDSGAEYVIVGHSERRRMGETDEFVNKKALQALRSGLSPIICIGETLRDEQGEYLKVLEDQIKASVPVVPPKLAGRIMLAYEPVWAIGANAVRSATPGEVLETALFIRKIYAQIYSKNLAFKTPILYGGSVDPTNAGPVLKDGGVQGLLVGRESLQEKSFPKMICDLAKV